MIKRLPRLISPSGITTSERKNGIKIFISSLDIFYDTSLFVGKSHYSLQKPGTGECTNWFNYFKHFVSRPTWNSWRPHLPLYKSEKQEDIHSFFVPATRRPVSRYLKTYRRLTSTVIWGYMWGGNIFPGNLWSPPPSLQEAQNKKMFKFSHLQGTCDVSNKRNIITVTEIKKLQLSIQKQLKWIFLLRKHILIFCNYFPWGSTYCFSLLFNQFHRLNLNTKSNRGVQISNRQILRNWLLQS